MLHDAFWPNLLVFAVGQAAAWFYLRTGRVLRGAMLMVAMLVLADLALVARFAYGAESVAIAAVWTMQVWALAEAGHLGWARWRRLRPRRRAWRRDEYRRAVVAELRGADAEAEPILRRLLRSDPWDVEAALALSTVARRLGERGRALRLARRVARLDRRGGFADILLLERGRLDRARTAMPYADSPPESAARVETRAPAMAAGEPVTTPSSGASPGPG